MRMRRTSVLFLVMLVAMLALGASIAVAQQTINPGPPSKGPNGDGVGGVQPVVAGANANCPAGFKELRIQSPSTGTRSDGTLTVNLVVNSANQTFDWTSNIGVDAVFVKGGDFTNRFSYDPEATKDTALHAPVNPNNRQGKFFGLSHLSFCYDLGNTPTIVTQASAPVTVGSPINDTATLSGATSNAGGTITFKLYSTLADCQAGTNEITTNLTPVPVNGNDTYPSGPVNGLAPGTYFWTAEYSGDANNAAADEKTCPENERSVVNQAASTIDTEQSYIPNDSATVTGNGTPTGSVKFELFKSLDCSGTAVFTETVPLSNGTASTSNSGDPNTNGGYTINAGNLGSGDFSWKVTYDGDSNNAGSTSCKEESRVIIDDDDTVSPNPLAAVTT